MSLGLSHQYFGYGYWCSVTGSCTIGGGHSINHRFDAVYGAQEM